VPLNNGATLGHRPETYDSAASNFYTYSVYDFFGNEQLHLFLEVYDLDDDGVYETLYTASKYDAPDSLWYDDLLTKKEFLRALDLLLQKVTDAELLNVRANDGPVAVYCEGDS
jgi:hypothetical protein